MKFENTRVFNFEGAIRGMRNPKNSWDKSDSKFGLTLGYAALSSFHDMYHEAYGKDVEYPLEWVKKNVFIYDDKNGISEYALIGPKDMQLATTLCAAGPEHRKFLRQIFVSVDITAPLYWYKEFDTYKLGTTPNSTSTMHKLAETPITLDCFEIDDYENELDVECADQSDITPAGKEAGYVAHWHTDMFVNSIISHLEDLRKMYLITKDKKYWKELIRWLPEGWSQTRTWTANYEVLRNMYHQRKNHKLTEWHSFCAWVESLPYAQELIIT